MIIPLIYLCLVLIALTLGVMLVFGLKNASQRLGAPESRLGLIAYAIPAILTGVFFALNQTHPEGAWTVGAIWATLVMSGLVLVALLVSGARGLFGR